MTTSSDLDSDGAPPPYRDRQIGLILCGSAQLFLGLLCTLLLPLTMASVIFGEAETGLSVTQMLPGLVMYFAMAVMFFTTGVGSIRCRRWARALSTILFGAAVIIGAGALVAIVAIFLLLISNTADPPAGVAAVIALAVGMAFVLVLYVIVPGAMFLFYHSRHTRLTCEARDPKERWTDRCPLPVLALSLISAYASAVLVISTLPYQPVFPVFGTFLTGIPAMVLMLLVAAAMLVFARGAYHLKPSAWRGLLLISTIVTVSAGITFTQKTTLDYYSAIGYPQEQIELMQTGTNIFGDFNIMLIGVLYGVIFVAFVAYTRRYFFLPKTPPTTPPAGMATAVDVATKHPYTAPISPLDDEGSH